MSSSAGLVQALLFVAGEAVEMETLAAWAGLELPELKQCIETMGLDSSAGGLVVRHVGTKVQLVTNPCYSDQLARVFAPPQTPALSSSLLETLAIVAYKQPATRAEIEQIRGVRCVYAINSLLERGLICKSGVKDVVGRPALYSTTDAFLTHFGLDSLRALPPLDEDSVCAAEQGSQEDSET